MMNAGDGCSSVFEGVSLPDEGEVDLLYIQQFQGYSLDLLIELNALMDYECFDWVWLVEGEFC